MPPAARRESLDCVGYLPEFFFQVFERFVPAGAVLDVYIDNEDPGNFPGRDPDIRMVLREHLSDGRFVMRRVLESVLR